MRPIPFVKYTSCGNNFVILDTLSGAPLREAALSDLAFQATNLYFGVGADNLLVVQRCDGATLGAINDTRGYWTTPPGADGADLVFRMFEPEGDEAFCCGNGLLCIADYLHRRRATDRARIMVEIPLEWPSVREIGVAPDASAAWADMGEPRRMPESLVQRPRLAPITERIDRLDRLEVKFRQHDLAPFSDRTSMVLSAYLVFTGEPHLVVFPEQGLAEDDLAGSFFSSTVPHVTDTSGVCQRVNFGTFLLRRIGYYLNRRCRDLFPAGINVNVARVDPASGALEYRCFERGINRETLACGTGALAVAYVARALGMLDRDEVTVWPHRCRWYEPETVIEIGRAEGGGWTLASQPRMLCSGELMVPAEMLRALPADDLGRGAREAAAAEMDDGDGGHVRLAS